MSTTKIINLTPHTINVLDENKKPVITLPTSGAVARVSTTRQVVGHIITDTTPPATVWVSRVAYGEVVGLPEYNQDSDVFYVVSSLVKAALPNRGDLLTPGELVRNEAGQPVGCIGLDR